MIDRQPAITRRGWIVMLAASATALTWAGLHFARSRPLHFERNRWHQARRQEEDGTLARLAQDLVDRKVLIGKTRTQVIGLLDEPEFYSGGSHNQLYYLIREDIDGIDPVRLEYLLISLDQSGRVVDARIVTSRRK